MTKVSKKAASVAAATIGRLGGSANTPAQLEQRRQAAKLAGPPRRVCDGCGEPVLRPVRDGHGGHKDRRLDVKCRAAAWHWQTKSEQRALESEA